MAFLDGVQPPLVGNPAPPIREDDSAHEHVHWANPSPKRHSTSGERILENHLSDWIAQFKTKNADYQNSQFSTADLLGAKGQFAELWRKIGKLYGPMWEGKKLTHEQPIEILQDLIGHCFLAIDYLTEEIEEELDDL